ncbi:hypothetical protein [Mesorhizobium captivum]|uniref:hypothetical protein n=1 Tax=Mesorhizobium captivum TaxID=3072319 RepID=UPI002A23C857|nr:MULTISPECIES: hypothetical protein [unclassified Mesorhizobium]MDX8502645.1 hypothetical protein [Mesorhizobium sp. VK4C]MDX8514693.1 hypothetical protein [Mesorhizobium sp. VK23E]
MFIGLLQGALMHRLPMAVVVGRSWTGVVVEDAHVTSREIQSQGGRGHSGTRMERHIAVANAEFRYRLRDRNGTQLKPRDAKRAMMTSLR